MSELRQQFIDSTVKNLEILRDEISTKKDFSVSFIKEVFRQIHTIKGTAQTFGLEKSSRIAHELENLLSEIKNKRNDFYRQLLSESITALKESFDEKKSRNETDLIQKLKNNSSENHSLKILPELPQNIVKSLSGSEIASLSSAFASGKTIFCFEIYFPSTDFREKLLKFREVLERRGEIVATLTAESERSQIGFRLLFAGEKDAFDAVRQFAPTIVFEFPAIDNELSEVLREITAHGVSLAKRSEKQIEFKIFTAEISPSKRQIKIIFDALLHLIRNAVSHAFEIPSKRIETGKDAAGKIEIRFSREDEDLKISVSDDGTGIDAKEIRLKAVKKNLISENEELSNQEIINLIFLSGISTGENLTEISGRGVGLDAVKNEIENAGGTIKVKNTEKFGTRFEIILPAEI